MEFLNFLFVFILLRSFHLVVTGDNTNPGSRFLLERNPLCRIPLQNSLSRLAASNATRPWQARLRVTCDVTEEEVNFLQPKEDVRFFDWL